MRIRISRVAKCSEGKIRAFTIKINGAKYPKEHRGYYFTRCRYKAKEMALCDYLGIKIRSYDYFRQLPMIEKILNKDN
tara:strand:+ start:2678 stop:2911 length:234 start_codon:yes stop_codon:yes gene_type:complete